MNDRGESIKDLNSDEQKIKENLVDYIASKTYPIDQIKKMIKEDIREIVWEATNNDTE